MDTDKLIDLVRQWGRDKGINNPKTQLNKVLEELGELAHELNREHYDTPEMVDAVGDTLVTVIILADILKLDPRACLLEAYNEIADRKGHTVDGSFIKEEA